MNDFNINGYEVLEESRCIIEDIQRKIVSACLHPEEYSKDFIHEQRCKLEGMQIVNELIVSYIHKH